MLLQVIGVFSPVATHAAESFTPTPRLDQPNYRWRVDDASVTWAADGDTALTDHEVETNIRLRMSLANSYATMQSHIQLGDVYDVTSSGSGFQRKIIDSAVYNGYVYAIESYRDADSYNYCRIYAFLDNGDMTSPASVTELPKNGCTDIAVGNGYLYVGGITNGYYVYETEEYASLELHLSECSVSGSSVSCSAETQILDGSGWPPMDMTIEGGNLYIASSEHAIHRVAVGSLGSGVTTKTYTATGNWPMSIAVIGDYVYVGTSSGYIYQFSKTGAMDGPTTKYTGSAGMVDYLYADGGNLISLQTGSTNYVRKIDTSNFSGGSFTSYNFGSTDVGNDNSVAYDSVHNLLYLGSDDFSDFIKVFDVDTMSFEGIYAYGTYKLYSGMSFSEATGYLYSGRGDDAFSFTNFDSFKTLFEAKPVLQVGTKGSSCYDVSDWANVPDAATGYDEWGYVNSTYVTNGEATTNIADGLLDPVSGSFYSGAVMESASAASSLVMYRDDFTEVEFSIAPTAYATGSYCFRIADANGISEVHHWGYPEISVTGGHEVFPLEASGWQVESKLDPSGTYVYLLGHSSDSNYPKIVQKVRASDLEHVATFSLADHYIYGFDLDSTGTYGYFLASAYDINGDPTQEKILKVQLSNMSIVDSDDVTFAIDSGYRVNVFLGPSGDYLYVIGISNYDSVIAKHNLASSVSNIYSLSTDQSLGDYFLSAAVSGNGYAFTGTDDGNVMKFDLNDDSDDTPAFLLSYNVSNAPDTDWDDFVHVSVNSSDSHVYVAGYDSTEAAGYAVKLNLADLTEVAGTYATSATLIGVLDGAIDVSTANSDDYAYYVAATVNIDYPNSVNSIFRVNFTTAPLSVGPVQTLDSGAYDWYPATIVVDQTDGYFGIYDEDPVQAPNDDLYAVSLATFGMSKSPISFTEGTYDSDPPASTPTQNNVVRLGRLKASTETTVDINFDLTRQLSGTLTVTFPAEFTLNEAVTPTKSACLSAPVINNAAHTVTATKTNCNGSIFISGIGITTPSNPGQYVVSWVNDDPGQSIVIILSNDQVNVTANVDPFLTFDVDTNTDCSLAAGGGDNDISLGVLASGVVSTGSEHICLSLDTNASGGAVVEYKGANKGLSSAAAGYVIGNAQTEGVQVDLDGQSFDGMGLCVPATSVVTTTPAGSIVSVAPYNGTCVNHIVGSINTSFDEISNTALDAVDGNGYRSVDILVKAMSVGTTPAASDYTNTLTFRATGTF